MASSVNSQCDVSVKAEGESHSRTDLAEKEEQVLLLDNSLRGVFVKGVEYSGVPNGSPR
jgi:hypothetical protein